MKKNILYVRTDNWNKNDLIAGGSVSHTIGVIKGFIAQGYTVHCASSIMLEVLKKLTLSSFHILKNPKWIYLLRWKINCILSSIFFTQQVIRIIKGKKIDFLYQRYGIFNCTGVLIYLIKKIPLILEYNGSEVWINTHWGSKKNFSMKYYASFIESINLKYAHTIVVVSDVLQKELITRGISGKKIVVAPNGVDSDILNPKKFLSKRAYIRTTLKLEDKFVFGFVGTFSQWHGIDLLARILPTVIEKNRMCHFLFIGDGPCMDILKKNVAQKKLKSHVTFLGIVSPEKAYEYLSSCDAFLAPNQPNSDGSRFFGSPTKLFEYMSFAKPIIASDLEQISQVLHPAIKNHLPSNKNTKKIGFLIAPHDDKKFIECIYKVSQLDKKLAYKIGLNARMKVQRLYSWKHHVMRIEAHIEKRL